MENNTIASQYFHGKEGFNCCQAVLKAYAGLTGMTDEYISAEFRKFGGGRAPGGMCGAIYAAVILLENKPDELKAIMAEFVTKASSDSCRGIRMAGRLPCRDCVELTGELLADVLKGNK